MTTKTKEPSVAKKAKTPSAAEKVKAPGKAPIAAKKVTTPSVVKKTKAPGKAPSAAKKEKALSADKTMLKIQQYGSPIRRDGRQRLYLKSLGLGKMNAIRLLEDNQTVRGLLAKVPHMVRVISE